MSTAGYEAALELSNENPKAAAVLVEELRNAITPAALALVEMERTVDELAEQGPSQQVDDLLDLLESVRATVGSVIAVADALQPEGSHGYNIDVGLTAQEGHHEAARALAEKIALLGPEGIPEVAPYAPPAPVACTPKRRDFAIGQRVWCNVHGAGGEYTITAVGEGHNRGRVKVSGERCWCPIGNFDALEMKP